MTGTITKFKGWTKPASVLEALERSLEHARIEEKWASGAWFNVDIVLEHDEFGDDVTEASKEEFDKTISGMTCTDVPACSAGIVAIETLDGEALYHYLANSEELDTNWLAEDPIFAGAIKLVARGFEEVFGTLKPAYEGQHMPDADSVDGAVNIIIARNDSESNSATRSHHARIVASFEKAVELAKA
jgi:hypothetical protein